MWSVGGLCFSGINTVGRRMEPNVWTKPHMYDNYIPAESHLSCSISGMFKTFMSIYFFRINGSKSSCRDFRSCDRMRRFVEHTCIFIVCFGCLVTADRGWEVLKDLGAPPGAGQKPWNMEGMTDIYHVRPFFPGGPKSGRKRCWINK